MAVPKVWSRREMQVIATPRRARRREPEIISEITPENRLVTVLIIRWGLAAVSMGLLLTADPSTVNWTVGLAAVATLAASNLALARQNPVAIESIALSVGIGLLDAMLIGTAWFASGHESFTVVIVSLGLLNLALAGLSLPEIGAIALASLIIYSVIGQVD